MKLAKCLRIVKWMAAKSPYLIQCQVTSRQSQTVLRPSAKQGHLRKKFKKRERQKDVKSEII